MRLLPFTLPCPPTSRMILVSLFLLAASGATAPNDAHALSCGIHEKSVCKGTDQQFAGGFNPGTGYGGFGGSACKAHRTPVIFIHGNADGAVSWDAPPGNVTGYPTPPRSVYAEMKARGYKDCELFGVTYLNAEERKLENVGKNYHQPAKYRIIHDFILAVQAYTGKPQVDIVAHSLGVTQTLATLHYYKMHGSVRKFVNIAGGLRGLASCQLTGFANPQAPTCGSQNLADSNIFGFYPEGFAGLIWVTNRWTGSGSDTSLREAPRHAPATMFYTIGAGYKDEVACAAAGVRSGCNQTTKFDAAPNVKAQIDIGAGADAAQLDLDWSDKSPFNRMGGDASNGIGHFRAKDNAGSIIYRMLQTDCRGLACAWDYNYGPKSLY
ncbi:lipase [Noviherbaspirillum sedimenti]|uniref:Lipase n=1 Tax=Noviherbaspirillum sedimenti TaxID=2320865 RepID=A0A3A3G7N8_9BURK|nr:lipase [Noviherbaspirillum sedimenti]RJG02572.1 lipase [Noviherbaspirillum sedimenti]